RQVDASALKLPIETLDLQWREPGGFTGSLREIQRSLKEFLPAPKHKKALPQLNVTARNCGMTTDAVKKILQVADGGTDYLFIAKTDQGFTAWLGVIER
ncbi:MAG: domain-like, partial [Bacteroidota bacterium]